MEPVDFDPSTVNANVDSSQRTTGKPASPEAISKAKNILSNQELDASKSQNLSDRKVRVIPSYNSANLETALRSCRENPTSLQDLAYLKGQIDLFDQDNENKDPFTRAVVAFFRVFKLSTIGQAESLYNEKFNSLPEGKDKKNLIMLTFSLNPNATKTFEVDGLRLPNGEIYSGKVLDGVPHGKGRLLMKGQVYTGEFKEGKMDGEGSLHILATENEPSKIQTGLFHNNNYIGQRIEWNEGTYIGLTKEGKPHGAGTLEVTIDQDKKDYKVEYDNGNLKKIYYSDDHTEEGTFEGLKLKEGIITSEGNKRAVNLKVSVGLYNGPFYNSNLSEAGYLSTSDGKEFRAILHGEGVLKTSDGKEFKGNFEQGSLEVKDMKFEKGTFSGKTLNGQITEGNLVTPDEIILDGTFLVITKKLIKGGIYYPNKSFMVTRNDGEFFYNNDVEGYSLRGEGGIKKENGDFEAGFFSNEGKILRGTRTLSDGTKMLTVNKDQTGNIVEGTFNEHGQLIGAGEIHYNNGTKESGNFFLGKLFGQGKRITDDGEITGLFVDGEIQDPITGKRIMETSDKELYSHTNKPVKCIYAGNFKDGKLTGEGLMMREDGWIEKGIFVNGNLIKGSKSSHDGTIYNF